MVHVVEPAKIRRRHLEMTERFWRRKASVLNVFLFSSSEVIFDSGSIEEGPYLV